MIRTRAVFGVFLLALAGMLFAVRPASVSAQEIDLDAVNGGIEGCTDSDTVEGRVGCYASLCEPSYRCAEALLRAATTSGGPSLGTTVLDDIMTVHADYAVFTDGHELAHVVGRQLAKEFGSSGDAFMRCSREYYYGCQHGFFEIVLANSPSPVDAAQSVCESAPVDQRFFCYHGVGHGFMMSYAYKLDDVLEKCNQLPEADFKRIGCWQGSFMENINSYLRGEAREGVFDPKNPLGPCDKLSMEYQWECYYNHASFLLRIHDHDVAKASAECMAADPQSRAACTRGIGQLVGNPGWQKVILGDDKYDQAFLVERSLELCDTFPKGEQENCVTGLIENMLNYDLEADALKTCSLLANYEGQRGKCYGVMGGAMLRTSYMQSKRLQYCPQFPAEYQSYCNPDAASAASSGSSEPASQQNIFVRIWHAIGDFFSGFWRMMGSLFAVSDSVRIVGGVAGASSSAAADVPPETVVEEVVTEADAVIRFADGAFTPEEVTIEAGQTVQWINDTEDPFWPASNDHPTHQVYENGAFDPGNPVRGGESWSFTFDQAGDWKFHDHLSPTAGGVVHVR